MDFTQYSDIYDFYRKTGMTREQAYEFLRKELEEQEAQG